MNGTEQNGPATTEKPPVVDATVVESDQADASNVNPEVLTVPTQGLVPSNAATLQPLFEADAMIAALQSYLKLQQALDHGLSECTVNIQGKVFRKRTYWEAVATAFDLSVECITEERAELGELPNGKPDGGWFVRARATHRRSGRFREGDGACFMSEKVHPVKDDDGNIIDYNYDSATEHNTRSHAHTRAENRAISRLVGFGEVSADEINQKGQVVGYKKGGGGKKKYASKKNDTRVISEPQRKRLYAIMKSSDKEAEEVATFVQSLGFQKSNDITRNRYDEICEWVEKPKP